MDAEDIHWIDSLGNHHNALNDQHRHPPTIDNLKFCATEIIFLENKYRGITN